MFFCVVIQKHVDSQLILIDHHDVPSSSREWTLICLGCQGRGGEGRGEGVQVKWVTLIEMGREVILREGLTLGL